MTSEEEAIALPVLQKLQDVTKDEQPRRFYLQVRHGSPDDGFSRPLSRRKSSVESEAADSYWDEAFLEQELEPNQSLVKKVYVCGPPLMVQKLDEALEKVFVNLEIERQVLEIL